MLKISTYEIQEKAMDIYLSSISARMGKCKFNELMMRSNMHIRSILQSLINRDKNRDRKIENVYTGRHKIPYVNVMDTVYSKGGVIVDWITTHSLCDMHVRDLDYSVCIESRDIVRFKSVEKKPIRSDKERLDNKKINKMIDNDEAKKDESISNEVGEVVSHEQISARIERELRWMYSEQENIKVDDLVDALFDGFQELELYNAYDETKPAFLFKRSSIRLVKPRRFVCHYSVMLNDSTELHRYYYSMYIHDGESRHEIKLNIVDLSIEVSSDYMYKSNLEKRYFENSNTYIITQSKLSLLNDQLVSLLYSSVTLNSKYEKRKQRVYNLLLELDNEEIRSSSIRIDAKKKMKEAKRPFEIVYFCRHLCENGVNLKDWIVRIAEDKNLDSKESQASVCMMMYEVLPRVVRRFKFD